MRALKTTLLLALLSVLMVLIGGTFGGQNGLYFGFAAMAVVNLIAYFASDKIALAQNHAQPVTREQAPRLYEVMERLCGKSGIPMPKLYVTPEEAPNAFATGRSPHHASVAVTAGLMKLLNDEELEGVIAHELSHVRNYDILITSVAAMLAGTITLVARMAFWFGGAAGGRRGNTLGSLLMMILGPLAAVLLQLGISRQREYAADAAGVRLVGHAEGLISALGKLGEYNKRIPMNVSPTTASLYIVAPLTFGSVFRGLFSTHPPLAERIAVLRNMTILRS
jgi:heat shock protein HtpX